MLPDFKTHLAMDRRSTCPKVFAGTGSETSCESLRCKVDSSLRTEDEDCDIPSETLSGDRAKL